MRHLPLACNPLLARSDMQRALVDLCAPLRAHASPGSARIRLGDSTAHFPRTCQEMEGYCRLLWGLAPLLAGGGSYDSPGLLEGLIHGVDPRHPEFWGEVQDHDQRAVESGAIAYAILLAPQNFWQPLAARERTNLSRFLARLNRCSMHDNNWLLFRALANLALLSVGENGNEEVLKADLRRIDAFYLGNGWYSDGPGGRCDHYAAFAILFYLLLCQKYSGSRCWIACEVRERAEQFAEQYLYWCAGDGPSLPYGRSLTYRFAHAAFWGALMFGGGSAVPLGVVKGIILRHLRWWFSQPIFTETGLLTVGYAYPNLLMAEKYNSRCSPYWALKAFLPLALPGDHPFWKTPELAMPELPAKMVQQHPKLLLCRDRGHVMALAGGPRIPSRHRHGAEKYSKFCYSTRYGFSVPSSQRTLAAGAHDSMLALGAGGRYFRTRACSRRVVVTEKALICEWSPWVDVDVTTWLIPVGVWHVRVHHLRTGRRLIGAEGGFALGIDHEQRKAIRLPETSPSKDAAIQHGDEVSVVRNLCGVRRAYVTATDPNTNLMRPRTAIPTLLSRHGPGVHWLACAVFAGTWDDARQSSLDESAPGFCMSSTEFSVRSASGQQVFVHTV